MKEAGLSKTLRFPACVLKTSGFTLVELISVLLLTSILAAVAVPRLFNRHTFDARTSVDQAQSMIRFAQKIAIAQNRKIYVTFASNSGALCFDAACATPLLDAVNKPKTVVLATGINFGTNPQISGFYFNALGRPFNINDVDPVSSFSKTTITLNGGDLTRSIIVEPETGYVHQ